MKNKIAVTLSRLFVKQLATIQTITILLLFLAEDLQRV